MAIQQIPVRAAANKIKGLSTTRGSREPVSFPRPLIFESYYNLFYARSRPRPNLQFTASVKAFQSIRSYASTSSYRQPATTPGPPSEASKDSRGADNSNNAQNSKEPNETTLTQTAIAAVKSIRQEIAWIQGILANPNVQLTAKARAKNKARLAEREQDYRHWTAKVDWWKAIYDKEPREIKQASDVYQRGQIVKAALETDAESKEPVWTAHERTTLEAHLGRWEAEVRKGDRWYKKIAWGPSIIGTAILNMILPELQEEMLDGLDGNFRFGRQLTDQELETLKRGRLPHNEFNLRLTITSPHSLDIGESQGPDAQDINPQTYFEDLVSTFTSDENLPRVAIIPDDRAGPIADTIPLYGLNDDGKPSLPKDTVSGEGYALALRVLPRMLYCNLCVRLQQEMSSMLESKMTDDSQMERADIDPTDPATFKRNHNAITKDLTAAEKSVLDAMMRRNFPSSSELSISDHDSDSQPSEDIRDPESASQPREDLHDLESSSSPRPQGSAKNLHKKALIPRTRMAISTIYDWIRGMTSNIPVRADPEDVTIDDIELKEREFYKSQRRDRVARRLGMRNRLIAAVFGGLSLIVPMLIMAIRPSQVKPLVTSSVAVLLFAVGLAWKSTAKIETLLATTAAYAAVMVVFVEVNSN